MSSGYLSLVVSALSIAIAAGAAVGETGNATGTGSQNQAIKPVTSQRTVGSLLQKGESALKGHNFLRARLLFEKALAINPSSLAASLGLARSLIGQKKYEEALGVMDKAEHELAVFKVEQQ